MATAQDIIDRAAWVFRDAGHVTWTEPEILGWIETAQREIVGLKPYAHIERLAHQLVANKAEQSLPPNASHLIDIPMNLGADGATPGRSIRIVSADALAAQIPDWPSAPIAAAVRHYLYDHRSPRLFWVYPRPASALYIAIVAATDPGVIADPADPLVLDFTYESAILDYVLYRGFSKSADSVNGPSRAQAHYTTFLNSVNGGTTARRTSDPNFTTTQYPNQPNPVTTPAQVGR